MVGCSESSFTPAPFRLFRLDPWLTSWIECSRCPICSAKAAERWRDRLDPGDLEEALKAAAAIGDDRLQRRSQGYVVPDAFTHGSSEQRVRWFRQGLTSGDPNACNTFEAGRL